MSELSHRSATEAPELSGEEILPLVYEELRRLAATKMALERPGHTLQPTALVHEAWLRLSAQRNQFYRDRSTFFGAAAEVMRRILVDRARRRKAARRGGGEIPEELEGIEMPMENPDVVEQVHSVLDELTAIDPEKAEIIKLRFFVGLTFEEIAALLEVNERTVRRHWTFAKAWMCKELRLNESA